MKSLCSLNMNSTKLSADTYEDLKVILNYIHLRWEVPGPGRTGLMEWVAWKSSEESQVDEFGEIISEKSILRLPLDPGNV